MAQSLVLSIDVYPGLGISPLRTNIWLSYSQADLGPRSTQELFFSGFLKSLKLFFRKKICAHSERYRHPLAGIFEVLNFLLKHRVSIVTGMRSRISSKLIFASCVGYFDRAYYGLYVTSSIMLVLIEGEQNLTGVELSDCTNMWLWICMRPYCIGWTQ